MEYEQATQLKKKMESSLCYKVRLTNIEKLQCSVNKYLSDKIK